MYFGLLGWKKKKEMTRGVKWKLKAWEYNL